MRCQVHRLDLDLRVFPNAHHGAQVYHQEVNPLLDTNLPVDSVRQLDVQDPGCLGRDKLQIDNL